jgi:hypothetical protein
MACKVQREVFDDTDDPDFIADALDCAVAVAIVNASKKRYLFRLYKYRKGKPEQLFARDISQQPQDESSWSLEPHPRQAWLNDVEFLQKYRMSRDSFSRVLKHIEDDPIFHSKNRQQAPVSHQLMTWLKYAGTEGKFVSFGADDARSAITSTRS